MQPIKGGLIEWLLTPVDPANMTRAEQSLEHFDGMYARGVGEPSTDSEDRMLAYGEIEEAKSLGLGALIAVAVERGVRPPGM